MGTNKHLKSEELIILRSKDRNIYFSLPTGLKTRGEEVLVSWYFFVSAMALIISLSQEHVHSAVLSGF